MAISSMREWSFAHQRGRQNPRNQLPVQISEIRKRRKVQFPSAPTSRSDIRSQHGSSSAPRYFRGASDFHCHCDTHIHRRTYHWRVEKPNTQLDSHVPRLDGQMRFSIRTRDVRFCHGHRPIRRIARCAARVRSATDDHRRHDDLHQSARARGRYARAIYETCEQKAQKEIGKIMSPKLCRSDLFERGTN